MTWRWLESTRKLQEESFGVDYAQLEGDVLADYVTMNHSAAVTELSEFMQEVGWKSWAQPRGWVRREAALGELVDAAHFIANLANALGITDDQWEAAYRQKQLVNRRRQEDGYDGVTDKCSRCHRDLPTGGTKVINGLRRCAGCLAVIDDGRQAR